MKTGKVRRTQKRHDKRHSVVSKWLVKIDHRHLRPIMALYVTYGVEIVEEIRWLVAAAASTCKLPGMHRLLAPVQAAAGTIRNRGREEKFCVQA
jgi:hypothetical protein